MRLKQQQQRRQSLVAPLALVLGIVCVVQLQLLLRPRSSGFGSQDGSGSDALFGGAARKQQQGQHDGPQLLEGQLSYEVWVQVQRLDAQAIQAAKDGDLETVDRLALQIAQLTGNDVGAATGGGGSQVAQQQDAHTAAVEQLRGAPIAFVSFANGAFTDFISNWVLAIQRLGFPFLVGALDKDMATSAEAEGWPHLDVSKLVGSNNSFFRANFQVFRNMGATKVQLVLTMLEDLQVETVVVSDSDTVWLHDPSDYFAQHPTADWFISTDCLSHQTEAAWQPRHNQPRCGHVPGNGWGKAFNTGVFAVRNRPAAKELLGLWRDFLLDPSRTTTTVKNSTTILGITDQLALNILFDGGKSGPLDATPEDERVLLLRNGTLRLHPLPVLQFASGHVAFVQRLPWKYGVDPYVVHATFQRYPTNMHRIGKRGRFREFGMWFLDTEDYYAAPGARYLTYDNDVRRAVAALRLQQFPAGLPLLYKHLTAVSYQLALFRDALAASQMLNRTLVLPKSWCWCDYDWTPHVLEKCKIRGSDLELPFECPSDFVFQLPHMEAQGLDFRMPGFLDNPQVPEGVRRWRADVPMVAAKPGVPRVLPATTGLTAAIVRAAVLWPGMAQQELEEALRPLNETAVLNIQGMQPGLVKGFADLAQNKAFDAAYTNATRELYWCCAAEGARGDWAAFPYSKPAAFAAGYAAWAPPVLAVPKWCDIPLGPPKLVENTEYGVRPPASARYFNHPCQFLRNSTAAELAAALG